MIRQKPELKRPVRHDLILYKGQSWVQNLYYRIGDPEQVYPLDGWTAKAEIRPEENSSELSAEIHANVTGSEGMISLALTPEQTSELLQGVYYYDLQTTDENGTVKYWLYGRFIVRGRVTE